MAKVIQCPCGYSIREADEDTLIAVAQEHAKSAHGVELTTDQAMAMSRPEVQRRSNSNEQGH